MNDFHFLLCILILQSRPHETAELTGVYIIPHSYLNRTEIGRACINLRIAFSDREYAPVDTRKLSVLNLNDLLTPLCSQNCFLVLDNFLKRHLISPRISLIIRQFELAETCNHLGPTRDTIWIADSTIIYNANDEQLWAKYLGFSLVDLFQHSRKTKPWRYQIHIQLFPHRHVLADRNPLPPIMMESNSAKENFLNMMPSMMPKMKVLITQYSLDDNFADIILVRCLPLYLNALSRINVNGFYIAEIINTFCKFQASL